MRDPTAEEIAMHGFYAEFAAWLSELDRANPDLDPQAEYDTVDLADAYYEWWANGAERWGRPGRSELTLPVHGGDK